MDSSGINHSRLSFFPDKKNYKPQVSIYNICNPILRSSLYNSASTNMVTIGSSYPKRNFSIAAQQNLSFDKNCTSVHVVEEIPQKDMGSKLSFFSVPLVGIVNRIISGIFKTKEEMGIKEKSTEVPSVSQKQHTEYPEKAVFKESLKLNTILPQTASYIQNSDKVSNQTESSLPNHQHHHMQERNLPIKVHSTFNPNHFYHKNKVMNKNRAEKQRYDLLCDIKDDLGTANEFEEQFSSSYESCGEDELLTLEAQCSLPNITFILKQTPENKSSKGPNSFMFSSEDFPLMNENPLKSIQLTQISPKRHKISKHTNICPDDSEDEYVMYDDDTVTFTPNSSSGTPSSSFKSLLSRLKCNSRRQRQISECSEDSVVIFFDSDDERESNDCWQSSETETDDENDLDEETDVESATMETNQQPDSGFEERKVRFCLKPEIHVMHTWDFAYRQARKGPWEEYVRDQDRFKNRILQTEQIIGPVLNKKHRIRIFNDRFANL